MKCKLGMFVFLLFCMSVCIGAQAAGEVKVEPAGWFAQQHGYAPGVQ